ncbi:uncharacterized protein LOC136094527 [Hydra vulgaris]|uniref:uncharacterized protein LOC136094527 n=1 Tax=Hydra vulgaris TaxID=6087 RepID=UPI0032EA4902
MLRIARFGTKCCVAALEIISAVLADMISRFQTTNPSNEISRLFRLPKNSQILQLRSSALHANQINQKKFLSNRYTCATKNQIDKPIVKEAVSSSKISLDNSLLTVEKEDSNFFIIIHFGVLQSCLQLLSRCLECGDKVTISLDQIKKLGLLHNIKLECISCDWSYNFYSSPAIKNKHIQEVNVRAVMSFREIGCGHEALKTFAGCMNMPPPMTFNSYKNINNLLHNVYDSASSKCMKKAADEIRTSANTGASIHQLPVDCDISLDGTWQKRGYSSLNGVVSAISKDNKKVLDVHVMSKFCKSCAVWKKKKNSLEYEHWKANHRCDINHSKSSGAMESAGAIEIFHSSVEKYGLRYAHYIGDGDTASFNDVVQSKPYGDELIPIKWECIGHIQKRLGARLRNKRKELKGKLLSDGKKINGRGRLTDLAINTLQNFYGMAIRQNKELPLMRRAVGAVLYHCSDINSESRHLFCPRTTKSWCKWQKDKLEGTNTYKAHLNLPLAIKKEIEGIFKDLGSEDLLKKCLHGFTQNPNEALNQLIWNKCPKSRFVSRTVLEIGVYSAIINYNEGVIGLNRVFKLLNLTPGKYFFFYATKKDSTRIKQVNSKMSEKKKKQRKSMSAFKKGFFDKEKETEVETYSSGAH